jgi:hypothetical protein
LCGHLSDFEVNNFFGSNSQHSRSYLHHVGGVRPLWVHQKRAQKCQNGAKKINISKIFFSSSNKQNLLILGLGLYYDP